jgi:hypothetical protein
LIKIQPLDVKLLALSNSSVKDGLAAVGNTGVTTFALAGAESFLQE